MHLRQTLRSILGKVRARKLPVYGRALHGLSHDPIVSDAAVARLVAEWGDQWGNPCVEHRRAGWAHFHQSQGGGGLPANDGVGASLFSACDYACLAQAAMLLGLEAAADALTVSAYLRLEGAPPARIQPAVDAVRRALFAAHSPPESA